MFPISKAYAEPVSSKLTANASPPSFMSFFCTVYVPRSLIKHYRTNLTYQSDIGTGISSNSLYRTRG